MVGFYDGISHPVLGLDHFLAMISVGILSAQIGGRSIFTIPFTFVCIMIIGGILGSYFTKIDHILIEYGIIFSVIFLGLAIAIDKKLSKNITIVIIGVFGLFHGVAHGLEMPNAANPLLFASGFASGTAALHIFGVGIAYFAIKTKYSSMLLRLIGILFSFYGIYLFSS
tara:strand:+ start:1688 stop:2194 length:507 start_codon:yes stop_codon:yes gene_type:complete